jgi:hypothetical protein
MAVNLFQNSAKSIPTSDDQICRVNMEEIEIGGRKSHLPGQQKADKMTLSHVPNKSSSPGGQ